MPSDPCSEDVPGWRREDFIRRLRARDGQLTVVDSVAGRGVFVPARHTGAVTTVALAVLSACGLSVALLAAYVAIRDGMPQLWIGVGLCGVLGALFAVGVAGSLRQRRTARCGIVLTPEAVVVETVVPAVIIPWSRLEEIHTFHLRWGWGPMPAPTQNWIGFVVDEPGAIEGVGRPAAAVAKRLKSRPTVGVFATEILRIDPLAALAGMQWYLEHPEDRGRLGSVAGLNPFGR
jgi:hypothetical protein